MSVHVRVLNTFGGLLSSCGNLETLRCVVYACLNYDRLIYLDLFSANKKWSKRCGIFLDHTSQGNTNFPLVVKIQA